MSRSAELRVILVGAGMRAHKVYLPWLGASGQAEGAASVAVPVAVLDSDPHAARMAAGILGPEVAGAGPEELEALLAAGSADLVVIATPDHTHAEPVCQALRHGADVLVEKPLTITVRDARTVLLAERESTGRVLVGHNLRFVNLHRRVRRLITSGALGRVVGVSFDYTLNPGHGLSYFTRWHRHRAASGGLEITKAAHHFDLIGWWLQARAVTVYGTLRRNFHQPGLTPVPADADIHDTVGGLIEYDSGAVAQYSLTGSAPAEGYTCTIRGTEGTCAFEYRVRGADGVVDQDAFMLRVRGIAGPKSDADIRIPREQGSHGGADARMLKEILARRTGSFATAAQAARAVALGVSLRVSAEQARRVPVPDV